jgi:hypothetical protein
VPASPAQADDGWVLSLETTYAEVGQPPSPVEGDDRCRVHDVSPRVADALLLRCCDAATPEQLAELKAQCAVDATCAGVTTSLVRIAAPLDITRVTWQKGVTLFSKHELPPLDYVYATVVSLMQVCLCVRRTRSPLHVASHRIASHRIASHRIASHRIASSPVFSAPQEWSDCASTVFGGSYHAFVVHSGPTAAHAGYLAAKQRFGGLRCITFLEHSDGMDTQSARAWRLQQLGACVCVEGVTAAAAAPAV